MTEESNEPCFRRCERKEIKRFNNNELRKIWHEDEPNNQEALRSEGRNLCVHAKDKEIKTRREMNGWEVVEKPIHEKVLHTKYALKARLNEKGQVRRYKSKFVICGIEEQLDNEMSLQLRILRF